MAHLSPPRRALNVLVRTAHIASAVFVLGASTYGGDPGGAPWALLASGLWLVADEYARYGLDWFRWLQSWAVLAKIGLVLVGALVPEWLAATSWGALLVGSLISHAPGRVRQAPLWGEPGPCALRARTPEGARERTA